MFFSQIWSLCLLAAYLAVPQLTAKFRLASVRAAWVTVLAVSLAARLLPAFVLSTGATYDIESYSIVGSLVLSGKDVYTSREAEKRSPYLPLQMYWSAFSRQLADASQLSFVNTVKIAPILADIAIALVLFASLLRSFSLKTAFLGGLLYAVNPIPIFVSAYHGQFDALAVLPILLSLYSLGSYPWLSGIWLGIGILFKSWPILALPALLNGIKSWKNQLIFLALAGLIPLMAVLFYLQVFNADLTKVLAHALGYNRGIGVWGYTYLFRLLAYFLPAFTELYAWVAANGRLMTLVGLAAAWFLRARKETPSSGILTILVAFFAVTHAFAIQYLMWLIPFAILSGELKWLKRYTLAAFIYMFIAYNTLVLQLNITNLLPWPEADLFIIIPVGLPAWIVCVAWAYQRIFRPERNQAAFTSTIVQPGQPPA
jgi:hypothetical protein